MQSQPNIMSSSDSPPDNGSHGLLPHIQSQESMYSIHGPQSDMDMTKQLQGSKTNGFAPASFRSSFNAFPPGLRARHNLQNTAAPPPTSFRDGPSGFYPTPADAFSPHLASPTQPPHLQLYDGRTSFDYGNGPTSLSNGMHKMSYNATVDPYLSSQPSSLLLHVKPSAQQQHVNGFNGPYTNGVQVSSQTPFGPHVASSGSVGPTGGSIGVTSSLPSGMGMMNMGAGGPSQGNQQQEDISTIFVVGFPDDMQEREFQNMFTFSAGFEAATLKIPNKEYTAYGGVSNSNGTSSAQGNLRAGAGSFSQYGASTDHYSVVNVNHGGVIVDARDGSMSSWPLAVEEGGASGTGPQSHYPNGTGANMPPRKQIIGFAKFRTREDALNARDVLQGRRVDIEKGAVLKAEMAKKNLHTKRGVGPVPGGNPGSSGMQGNASFGQGMLGISSAGLLPQALVNGQLDPYAPAADSAQISPRDRELMTLNAMGLSRSAWRDQPNDVPVNVVPLSHRESIDEERRLAAMGAMGLGSSTRGARERAEDEERRRKDMRLRIGNAIAYDAFHSVPQQNTNSSITTASLLSPSGSNVMLPPMDGPSPTGTSPMAPEGFSNYTLNQHTLHIGSDEGVAVSPWDTNRVSTGHPISRRSSSPTNPSSSSQSNASKPPSEAHFREESDLYHGSRSSSATGGSQSSGKGSSGANLATAVGGLELNMRHGNTSPQLPSPESQSGASSGGGRSGVDQYPPINTLYVGNLPTSPCPPGLPPDILEQSLRELFSAQPGFRRLSFKQKSTGPMCFVEFEDVPCAAKTLGDLYGHTVNGLVKGNGIRLSYSKNPLGVRTPTSASSNGSTLQQQQQTGLQQGDDASAAVTRPDRRDMPHSPAGQYMASPPPPRFYAASPPSTAPFGPSQSSLTNSSHAFIPRSVYFNQAVPSFSPFGASNHLHSPIPDQDPSDQSDQHQFPPRISPSATNIEATRAA